MMNRRKMNADRVRRQYPLLLLTAVILAAAMMLGSTFSWFAQTDQVENQLKTQELAFAFRVDEDFTPPAKVLPGQTVEKAVRGQNFGDTPGVLRLLVLVEVVSAEGVPLPVSDSVMEFNDANAGDWLFVDGWWYFLGVLEPGEVTPNLFSGVTFANPLPEEYLGAGMKIEVKLEAVDRFAWNYRAGWWPQFDANTAPPAPFDAVDEVLKLLAI